MARLLRHFDGLAKPLLVVVDIAEDEMRRPAVKQRDDRNFADVAAVNDEIDMELFEEANRGSGEGNLSVRVANDADSHRGFFFRWRTG